MTTIRTLIAAAALLPTLALASPPKPGLYTLGDGGAGLCVQEGGTWYVVGWETYRGLWAHDAVTNTTSVFGSEPSVADNIAITVKGKSLNASEWATDLSYGLYVTEVAWVRAGRSCDVALAPNSRQRLLAR